LTGVSVLPDPHTHAYRKDLADTALAGRVIASHYAEPLLRTVIAASDAFVGPSAESGTLARVRAGDELRMLDCSRGWAWGYLADGRVVYISAAALQV
jgi:hypothetical protein